MRTRFFGLLASASIILSTAALAETTPVVLAFFRDLELRVDAALIAANLPSENSQAFQTLSSLHEGASEQALEESVGSSFQPEQTATASLTVKPQQNQSATVAETVESDTASILNRV